MANDFIGGFEFTGDESFLPKGYSFELISNKSILTSYLQFGESNIVREIELLREAYAKNPTLTLRLLKEDPDKYYEEEERIADWHYEEWHTITIEIGSRFRQSLIIQLYSFLEAHLYKQCEMHAIKYSKEYSVHDLRGNNDLDKVAMYMKNSAGIDIKQLSQWQFVNSFKQLRNILVHREGRIVDQNTYNKIKGFAKDNFEIQQELGEFEYKIILSNREFVEYCIEEIHAFLQQVVIA